MMSRLRACFSTDMETRSRWAIVAVVPLLVGMALAGMGSGCSSDSDDPVVGTGGAAGSPSTGGSGGTGGGGIDLGG